MATCEATVNEAYKRGILKVSDKDAAKDKRMETTIPCPEGPAMGVGCCCGCLTASYDKAEKTWVFRCNECSKEWGRGDLN